MNWLVGGHGNREIVRADLNGSGYVAGDADQAAEWAQQVVCTWLDIVRSDPIEDLETLVEAALPGQGHVTDEAADDED